MQEVDLGRDDEMTAYLGSIVRLLMGKECVVVSSQHHAVLKSVHMAPK